MFATIRFTLEVGGSGSRHCASFKISSEKELSLEFSLLLGLSLLSAISVPLSASVNVPQFLAEVSCGNITVTSSISYAYICRTRDKRGESGRKIAGAVTFATITSIVLARLHGSGIS